MMPRLVKQHQLRLLLSIPEPAEKESKHPTEDSVFALCAIDASPLGPNTAFD
jgi:hypothetical protein